MDTLEAIELALAAVDEGSLAAGARRLGRSSAAATRALAQLEDAASERLMARSTRGLRLTSAGQRHAAAWRDILDRWCEIKQTTKPGVVSGSLVVTAPELFGRLHVMPLLQEFLGLHPQASARVLLLNRPADLINEGIDVAFRLAEVADSSLASIKVGEVRRLVCASPGYLSERGEPYRPSDLLNHACIGLNVDSDRELWLFKKGGRDRSIQVHTRLAVNSAAAGLDCAIAGLGIVRVLSYQVASEIAAGRLVPLLSAYQPSSLPVQLLFRARPRDWSPTRAFIDHAAPRLRKALST